MAHTNIFQFWDSIGRKVPFAVRRENRGKDFFAIIDKVDCANMPYDKAYGYPMAFGAYSDHWEHDKKWKVDRWMQNGGSYQWHLVHIDITQADMLKLNSLKVVR